METKIIAAEIATAAGVTTIITSSKDPSSIFRIIEYDVHTRSRKSSEMLPSTNGDVPRLLTRPPHTLFTASLDPMPNLKSWTSHTLKPSGSVVIDAGAYHALAHRDSGGRLLAVGVIGVIGVFASEQAVRIVIPRRRHGKLEDELGAYLKAMALTTPTSLDPATMLREMGTASVVSDEDAADEEQANVFLDGDVIEVGRGLTNYNSAQIMAVKGLNRWGDLFSYGVRFSFTFFPFFAVLSYHRFWDMQTQNLWWKTSLSASHQVHRREYRAGFIPNPL